MRRLSILVLTIPAASGCGLATQHSATERGDLRHLFDEAGYEGSILVYDLEDDVYTAVNAERTTERFLPASTFKIPNTLIALETGVASGPDFALAWDSTVAPREAWWPEVWARDHTLRTALPNSVVWYYQELARRIGPERMQTLLDRIGYGNRDISGGIDQFWLTGGLGISQREQVDFLVRLYRNDLPVSGRAMDLVKELLLLEETAEYRLYGKTGWVMLSDAPDVGWWVGWVERDGNAYFFATNLESDQPGSDFGPARISITRAVLRELGVLDAPVAGGEPR